jgi:hypothetical protein
MMLKNTTYGTNVPDLSILAHEAVESCTQEAIASFPDTSETMMQISQLAQSCFDRIMLRKTPICLQYEASKIKDCNAAITLLAMLIIGMACLSLGSDGIQIGFGVPLTVGGLLGMITLGMLDGKYYSEGFELKLDQLDKKAVDLKKEIDKCGRLYQLLNQLAAMHKEIRDFYAEPHRQKIRWLFDHLEDLFKQNFKHNLVKTESLEVYNLFLLDEIRSAFQQSGNSNPSGEEEVIAVGLHSANCANVLNRPSDLKNVYLEKLSKEDLLRYYTLTQQGTSSVVSSIKECIDLHLCSYRAYLEETLRQIALESLAESEETLAELKV